MSSDVGRIWINGKAYDFLDVLQNDGMFPPSVSPLNSARIYFDQTQRLLMLSENGGAYHQISNQTTSPAGSNYDIQVNLGGAFGALHPPYGTSGFLHWDGGTGYNWLTPSGAPGGNAYDTQINDGMGGFSGIAGLSLCGGAIKYGESFCYGILTCGCSLCDSVGLLHNDGYGNLAWQSGGGYSFYYTACALTPSTYLSTCYLDALTSSSYVYYSFNTIYYLDWNSNQQQADIPYNIYLCASTSSFLACVSLNQYYDNFVNYIG